MFLNKCFEKVHFEKSADDIKGMKNSPDLVQRFKCSTKFDGLLYIVNGQSSTFPKLYVISIIFVYANSADPNEMSHSKLRSEIVWHRFFAVPAFIRRFRSYIAVRKLIV